MNKLKKAHKKAAENVTQGELGDINIDVDITVPFITMGTAYKIKTKTKPPKHQTIENDQIPAEINQFQSAHDHANARLEDEARKLKDIPEDFLSPEAEEVMNIEKMVLNDFKFVEDIKKLITEKKFNAPLAIYEACRARMDITPEGPLKKKMKPVIEKIRDYMLDHWPEHQKADLRSLPDDKETYIPIVKSVPVGMVGYFFHHDGTPKIHGMINWDGTSTDHTNIVGRSAGIAIARILKANKKQIKHGDMIIIDGKDKKIIVNPTVAQITEYKNQIAEQYEEFEELAERSRRIVGLPKTLDGQSIRVSGNIEYSVEGKIVNDLNGNGVGLYRTEVSVIGQTKALSAEKCAKNIICVAEALDSHILDVRTPDFEGDKASEMPPEEQEKVIRNYMAGVILAREYFANKLKEAEENAAAEGRELDEKIRRKYTKQIDIMHPNMEGAEHIAKHHRKMIEEVEKLNEAKKKRLGKELEEHEKYKPVIAGAMAEIPALYFELEEHPEWFNEKDGSNPAFLSFGGNDGEANTKGYYRFDPKLKHRNDPTNPAFMHNMYVVTTFAKTRGIAASFCGDIASQPRYTAEIIGSGFKSLSCGVRAIPIIKEMVSRIDTEEAKLLAQTMRNEPSQKRREQYRDHFNLTRLGLHPDGTLDMSWEKPTYEYKPSANDNLYIDHEAGLDEQPSPAIAS